MRDMQKLIDNANMALNKKHLQNEFAKVDRRAVSKFSDTELALWQSEFPSDSPQSIIAEHEWNRRLTNKQTSATKLAALTGFIGVVIGLLPTLLRDQEPHKLEITLHQEQPSSSLVISNNQTSCTSTNKNISNQRVEQLRRTSAVFVPRVKGGEAHP